MARVNTYLNFQGNTEEAFKFYETVFNSKITSLTRMKDLPRPEGAPQVTPEDAEKIMNVQLPIMNGHIIMATDFLESMGHKLIVGNNTTISLDFDSKEEAQRVYDLLAVGSEQFSPMADMPWGAFWGSALDQYGVRWMLSYEYPRN